MERLAIVLTVVGPIMGGLEEVEDGYELRKPRVLQVANAPNGQQRVLFLELVGGPELLNLSPDAAWFIPKDRPILDAYLESTSKIAIAHQMPRERRDA